MCTVCSYIVSDISVTHTQSYSLKLHFLGLKNSMKELASVLIQILDINSFPLLWPLFLSIVLGPLLAFGLHLLWVIDAITDWLLFFQRKMLFQS